MRSIDETKALSIGNAEFDKIRASDSPLLQAWDMKTNLTELRAQFAQMRDTQHATAPDPASLPYTTDQRQIPSRDGASISIRVYAPRDAASDAPGLVVFPGGGFCLGDLDMCAPLCERFVALGGVAIAVASRLAPAHPFPGPVEDCFDAVKWIAQNRDTLGISPVSGFLLGGESSGADLALGVAHLWREESDVPPLTGLYIAINSAVASETVPARYDRYFVSPQQNSEAPCFGAESVEFVRKQYRPDLNSPLAFPLACAGHRGIPRTYFQACGLDPVRDCTLVMEQVWRDEGIETRLDLYPGLPHAFWAIFPDAEFSRKQEADSRRGLEWLLESQGVFHPR